MRRFWSALVIIGLIGVVPAALFYGWLSTRLKPSKDMQALDYALHDTAYHDVVFLGASKVEVNLDPRVIDSITGFDSYNLTIDGMGVLEYGMLLDVYLQHHRAPRVVLISTDYGIFDNHRQLYNAADYFPYIDRDTAVGNLLKRFNPLYRDKLLRWKLLAKRALATTDAARYYAMFPETAPSPNPQDRWPVYKGFRAVEANWQPFSGNRGAYMPWRDEGFALLQRLVNVCRERGIEPIFFFAPEHISGRGVYENADDVMRRVNALAERNNVPFWNYADHPLSRDERFYYNYGHLNSRGAWIFSETVARDLLAHSTRGTKQPSLQP